MGRSVEVLISNDAKLEFRFPGKWFNTHNLSCDGQYVKRPPQLLAGLSTNCCQMKIFSFNQCALNRLIRCLYKCTTMLYLYILMHIQCSPPPLFPLLSFVCTLHLPVLSLLSSPFASFSLLLSLSSTCPPPLCACSRPLPGMHAPSSHLSCLFPPGLSLPLSLLWLVLCCLHCSFTPLPP